MDFPQHLQPFDKKRLTTNIPPPDTPFDIPFGLSFHGSNPNHWFLIVRRAKKNSGIIYTENTEIIGYGKGELSCQDEIIYKPHRAYANSYDNTILDFNEEGHPLGNAGSSYTNCFAVMNQQNQLYEVIRLSILRLDSTIQELCLYQYYSITGRFDKSNFILKKSEFSIRGELEEPASKLFNKRATGVYLFPHYIDTTFTPKQIEVLQLTGKGKSAAEIAQILGISKGTVEKHRGALIERARTRLELTVKTAEDVANLLIHQAGWIW